MNVPVPSSAENRRSHVALDRQLRFLAAVVHAVSGERSTWTGACAIALELGLTYEEAVQTVASLRARGWLEPADSTSLLTDLQVSVTAAGREASRRAFAVDAPPRH